MLIRCVFCDFRPDGHRMSPGEIRSRSSVERALGLKLQPSDSIRSFIAPSQGLLRQSQHWKLECLKFVQS